MAQKNAQSYNSSSFSPCASTFTPQPQLEFDNRQTPAAVDVLDEAALAAMYPQNDQACTYCGHPRHATRNQCPARRHKCKLCSKPGHWERVCRSLNSNQQMRSSQQFQQNQAAQRNFNENYNNSNNNTNNQSRNPARGTSAAIWPFLASTATSDEPKRTDAFCNIRIKSRSIKSLLDTGSLSSSFIDEQVARDLRLPIIPAVGEVALANASVTSKVEGQVFVNLKLQNRVYKDVKLYVLKNLCAEVILGQDFLSQHKGIVLVLLYAVWGLSHQ